jgi:hypothetical protein
MRRSARSNKGKHPDRDFDEIIQLEQTDSTKASAVETKDDEYDENTLEDGDDEGIVRCTPCGTTQDNYDEEKDTGGTFIQCDECNTWQHAKCMGFKQSGIPDQYVCNICDPTRKKRKNEEVSAPPKKAKVSPAKVTPVKVSAQEIGQVSLKDKLKDDHRLSTARAFYNYFKKSFPPEKAEDEKEEQATQWALNIEEIIFATYPNKRYSEGGRRILFLLKKHFMPDILKGTLTFEELVKKTPKEINQNIELVEEKVKDNIKNIILMANEPSDIIRRTHKGEIIRENENDHAGEIDDNMTTRKVDHRNFAQETETKISPEMEVQKSNYLNINPRFDDDEEPDVVEDPNLKPETKSSESSDLEHFQDNVDDDDILKLLSPPQKLQSTVVNPRIWTGTISFPDFATFKAYSKFYSCTTYSSNEIPRYNNILSDIFTHNSYTIEGRLDKRKADEYLNRVLSTREVILTEIKAEKEDEAQFQKLYQYLLIKNKVGVLSGKPWFVKDSYLIPIDFRDENLPYYLQDLKKDLQIGLFALFTVKKGYSPKESKTPKSPELDLRSIMSQLGN